MAAVHAAVSVLAAVAVMAACAGFVFVLEAIDTALTRLVVACWRRARARCRGSATVIDQASVDQAIAEMERQFTEGRETR